MVKKMLAEPSAKSLSLEMSVDGQRLATGTGIICASPAGPVLVTNRHNLTGRHQTTGQPLSPTGGLPNEVRIAHHRRGKLGELETIVESVLDASGSPLWVEHPTLGARADIVALKLTLNDGVQLYPYDASTPGADIFVGPSDAISVIGFPFGIAAAGFLPIWATGFMASEPDVDFDGVPTFLVDCRTRPGQSGSAVVAYRSGGMVAMADGSVAAFDGPVHRFLGLYSGRINAESDLGVVWKVEAVRDLVAAVRANV